MGRAGEARLKSGALLRRAGVLLAVEPVHQRQKLAADVRADPGAEGLAPIHQLVAKTRVKTGGIQRLVLRPLNPPKEVRRVRGYACGGRLQLVVAEPGEEQMVLLRVLFSGRWFHGKVVVGSGVGKEPVEV